MLVLAPLLERVLRLDNLVSAVLVAATCVPLTLMGAQSGVLQGERRWPSLSLIYLALGLPRLVIGVAFMLWRPTQASAMLGVTVAAVVPAVVGWLALRHSARASDHGARLLRRTPAPDPRHPARDRAQLPGPAGVLRPVQRRRGRGPARARHRAGRALRRRADPDQGDAVPPAVRGRRGVPRHVDRGEASLGSGPEPRPGRRPRRPRRRRDLPAARSGPGVRRRRRPTRRSRTSCGSSPCSARCCRCSSSSSTPSWPAAADARSCWSGSPSPPSFCSGSRPGA